MQPDEVKWQLMIASCYRRSGNYHRALDTYKVIIMVLINSSFRGIINANKLLMQRDGIYLSVNRIFSMFIDVSLKMLSA